MKIEDVNSLLKKIKNFYNDFDIVTGATGYVCNIREKLEEIQEINKILEKGFNKNTYFIQLNEFVKIGTSNNPKKRLSQLQTANPNKLKLIHTTNIPEKELHNRFRQYRSNGEWFLFSQAIKDFIKNENFEYDLNNYNGDFDDVDIEEMFRD